MLNCTIMVYRPDAIESKDYIVVGLVMVYVDSKQDNLIIVQRRLNNCVVNSLNDSTCTLIDVWPEHMSASFQDNDDFTTWMHHTYRTGLCTSETTSVDGDCGALIPAAKSLWSTVCDDTNISITVAGRTHRNIDASLHH